MAPRFRSNNLGPIVSIERGITGGAQAPTGRGPVADPHTVTARGTSGGLYRIVVDGSGRYWPNGDYEVLDFAVGEPPKFDPDKPFKTREGLQVEDFRPAMGGDRYRWAARVPGSGEGSALYTVDGEAWKHGARVPRLDLVNLPEPLPVVEPAAAPAEAPAAPPNPFKALFLAAVREAIAKPPGEATMPTKPRPEGQMIVLTPDGERAVSVAKKMPGLGKLQRAVGGDVKPVPMFDTFEGEACVALAAPDSEGRANRQASEAWLAALDANGNVPMFTDDIRGSVVILTGAAAK